MNTTFRFFTFVAFFAIAFSFVPSAEARKLSKREFRNFYGVYEGTVAGVFGVSAIGAPSPLPTEFDVAIRVSGRRNVTIFSGTGRSYQMKISSPKGSKRRLVLVGTISGTFINPNFASPNDVQTTTGKRRMVVRRQGTGSNEVRTMRFREEITEGNLSYMNVRGNLEDF